MSERKPAVIVEDILTCIGRINQYTTGLVFDQFTSNFMAVEACLYNIQVMGEAVTKLPDDLKEKYPQIPWTSIKGMRNRLIHEYFGTDLQLVWEVINDQLPTLEQELKLIHASLI